MSKAMFTVEAWTPTSYNPSATCPVEPATILTVDDDQVTALDFDHDVDLTVTTADAFVQTDKGFHLFWQQPKGPTQAEINRSDAMHNKVCEEEGSTQLFYRSKLTARKRACGALTADGLKIAAEYNRIVAEAE